MQLDSQLRHVNREPQIFPWLVGEPVRLPCDRQHLVEFLVLNLHLIWCLKGDEVRGQCLEEGTCGQTGAWCGELCQAAEGHRGTARASLPQLCRNGFPASEEPLEQQGLLRFGLIRDY